MRIPKIGGSEPSCGKNNFSSFLQLFKSYLLDKKPDLKRVQSSWNTLKLIGIGDNSLAQFVDFLAHIEIFYPSEESNKSIQGVNQNLQQLINEQIALAGDISEQRKPYKEIYSWFSPSLQIGQLLIELYDEEIDPGRIISNYINRVYSNSFSDEIKDILIDGQVNDPEFFVSYDTPEHVLLKDVLTFVVNNNIECLASVNYVASIMGQIIDPCGKENKESNLPFEELLINVISLPKEIYYLWMKKVLINAEAYEWGKAAISNDELKTILKYIPIGKNNFPLLTQKNLEDRFRREYINTHWKDIYNIIETKYISYTSFFRLIDYYFFFNEKRELDDENKALIKWIIEGMTEFRHKYLAGNAPFDLQASAFGCELIEEAIGIENTDIVVLIASAYTESNYSPFEFLNYDIEHSYQEKIDFYNRVQDNYIEAFYKAVDDGHPELAVALLSLGIFIRGFTTKATYGNLPKLTKAIKLGITLPGSKVLSQTLNIICDAISNYFIDKSTAKSTLAYFQPFVLPKPNLHLLHGGGKLKTEPDVASRLLNELEQKRWDKLSDETKELLISGEMLWKNSAPEFGLGIKDWSGVIIPYCKAIECELVRSLKDLYFSDAYKVYQDSKGTKRSSKPSAGFLLRDLKDYTVLPKSLQDIIVESGITLHENSKLIRFLIDIMDNYRNKSAHTDLVGIKEFTEFRYKLFYEKGLQKFIDCLP